MATYPTDFPLTELGKLLTIITEGTIKERWSEFALNTWWAQGYAQKIFIGYQCNPQAQSLETIINGETDPVKLIQRVINEYTEDPNRVNAQSYSFIWGIILQFALEKLFELIKDKLQK